MTRGESVVRREDFRKAFNDADRAIGVTSRVVRCQGRSYEWLNPLGQGETSEVGLGRRVGALPLMVVLKLSSAPNAASIHAREAQVLRELGPKSKDPSVEWLSRHIPEVVACGPVEGDGALHALVLRHAGGWWGSLAALHERFPGGIDPRHAVWIWRRMLEILGLLHSNGWAHGDIRPEHALVHPGDHAIRIIGWTSARKPASADDRATDLVKSARVIQMLLSGATGVDGLSPATPPALSTLILRAASDSTFCRESGADGLDRALRDSARTAFGPPAFVPLEI